MMNIQQIFETALKMAISADPRGEKGVKQYLGRVKKEYEDLKLADKKYFDTERLFNPYADSRLHLGDPKKPVKRILAGIDIGSAEILLASQLNERGKKIDLVLAHHPIGRGLADLHGVMDMTTEVYENLGIPVHLAEQITEERIKEVGRSVHPANHFQVIDMAKLLQIDLMNTHTATDNLVSQYVEKFLKNKKPETINDLLKVLLEIPEYSEAKKVGAGPKLFAGNPRHRVGKFLMEMTGGTNPSQKVYEILSKAGISTIVTMHMKDDAMNKAKEQFMNVVVAGHISSDSLGMNLFLDELEKQGVEVLTCGGLIRVKRNKK
jgi:putative NIF3 family GTP cyclohydrolase 1 type 2